MTSNSFSLSLSKSLKYFFFLKNELIEFKIKFQVKKKLIFIFIYLYIPGHTYFYLNFLVFVSHSSSFSQHFKTHILLFSVEFSWSQLGLYLEALRNICFSYKTLYFLYECVFWTDKIHSSFVIHNILNWKVFTWLNWNSCCLFFFLFALVLFFILFLYSLKYLFSFSNYVAFLCGLSSS